MRGFFEELQAWGFLKLEDCLNFLLGPSAAFLDLSKGYGLSGMEFCEMRIDACTTFV